MKFLRATLALGLPALTLVGAVSAPPEKSPEQQVYETEILPSVRKLCGDCHGGNKPQAGLNFLAAGTVEALRKDPKIWRSAVQRLKEKTMPPPGSAQPIPAERDRLVLWLSETLDKTEEKAGQSDPGRVLLHRLNREEYNNTVRDLFGVSVRPADRFPADGGGGAGFDNNADTLFVPPVLLERYLVAADEVLAAVKPERLFFVQPGPKLPARSAAKKILGFHASRAWRRPVDETSLAPLMALYDGAVAKKLGHEAGIKRALKAALVSPRFLFRIEDERPVAGPAPLDDYALASRLSYFLWSSMPDDELFQLAREKKLQSPAVLDAQVTRMLASPKAAALADGFLGQWLRVRDLYTATPPDPGKFPQFTPSLRDAMYAEPTRFFLGMLRENLPLTDLLDARYTYVNEELAKHYEIPGVTGPELRKVSLKDERRGGVLGMASVLTVTSYTQRTSPVLRGKWILSELLGAPPPPPPPSVPSLSQNDAPEAGLTFRQRLEKHREKPECAGCHSRMDPLGFGLENYDVLGRWRDKLADAPVDASGTLPGGQSFTGPGGLKTYLKSRKPEFTRHVAEKMLSYALGRGLEPGDLPAVRKASAALARSNGGAATLVKELVKSDPFRKRSSEGLPKVTVR